jgi:hypothetical protein
VEGDGVILAPRRTAVVLGPRRISAVYLWLAFVVLFGLLKPDTY